MTDRPGNLLVFAVNKAVYALDAGLVREILRLPALSPAPEAPGGVIGRFNLRGELVLVYDLDARLGYGSHVPHTNDQVIVLDMAGTPIGVIVSEVRDLVHLDAGTPSFTSPADNQPDTSLVEKTLQLGDDLVTVLNCHCLLQSHGMSVAALTMEAGMTPADQAVFQERSRALRQTVQVQDLSDTAFAVVELDGQYFGIDLKTVREFCRVPQLRPLPCCPPHIAGVFNLRGHLITLLDISSALNLPSPASPRPKAIITNLGREMIGIAIDEVIDVFNPETRDIKPLPPSAGEQRRSEIQALASFAGRTVAILDLSSLINLNHWTVDEIVA